MTDNNNDETSEDLAGERTSAFRTDLITEQDAAATVSAEGQLLGVEGPPQGSALLLVKRGPNAGARFSLDRPTTTAVVIGIATSSSTTSRSAGGTPSSVA